MATVADLAEVGILSLLEASVSDAGAEFDVTEDLREGSDLNGADEVHVQLINRSLRPKIKSNHHTSHQFLIQRKPICFPVYIKPKPNRTMSQTDLAIIT